MTPTQTNGANANKAKKHRSPAYPAITLEDAIKRARTFHGYERRNAASFATAVGHWGFKIKSSGGLTTVAALKSFGLMRDVDGGAGGRTVQLTELSLRILLDDREPSPERESAIKQAALSPKIHSELWTKWGPDLPSDSELRHQLIFTWKFNENSVADFIQEYRDTIKYAKLIGSDTISEASEDKNEEEYEEDNMPEVHAAPTVKQAAPLTGRPSDNPKPPKDASQLLTQALVVSIPRNFRVDINVRGDELRKEDLTKIKSQFNRWIEGLEEAFEE